MSPKHSGVHNRDPLTYLPSSHFFSNLKGFVCKMLIPRPFCSWVQVTLGMPGLSPKFQTNSKSSQACQCSGVSCAKTETGRQTCLEI